MPDTKIVIDFLVNTNDAIKRLKEMNELTKKIKVEMISLAKETGDSFDKIAAAMRSVKAAEIKSKIAGVGTIDPTSGKKILTDANKSEIAALRKELLDFNKATTQAVNEYKTSLKEMDKAQSDSNKARLVGTKSVTDEEIKLFKYKTGVMVEEARRQRESERQGLTGNALIAKAREQADAAKAAYKSAGDEYEKQVQQNIALSKQAEAQGDAFTVSELENGKKRANALDIERRALKQNASNAVTEFNRISSASKRVADTATGFSKLGTVLKYVFGSILGLSAVSALRSMVSFLSQAGEKALMLSKAMFTLNIAVRNMQRQGNPTSLGELRDEMAQFNREFDFFSELEVSRAFAEATNKLANLGYTTEQVANVVRAGMIVYITDLTGRFNDLGEAINGVTNYLASGYGESLERSGFIAGRAGDKMLAFEKGLGQSLATLDPLNLSQERYNLLLLQTAEKTKDAEEFTKTLAGAYKQAQADIVDATVNIGMATDDLLILWERNKAIIYEAIAESAPVKATIVQGEINQQIDLLALKYVEVQDEIKELIRLRKISEERGIGENRLKFYDDQIKTLQDLSMQLMKTTADFILFKDVAAGKEVFDTEQIDEFLRKTEELGASSADVNFKLQPVFKTQENTLDLDKWKDWFEDEVREKIRDVVEIPVTPKPLFTPERAKIVDAYEQMVEGLTEITEEETKRLAELWNDYVQDVGGYLQELDGTTVEIEANFVIGKLRTDLSQNLNDLLDDYLEKLPAIEADYQKKLADAQRDYATQVAQAARDFNIRRAQAERNYRLKELQAEREFQEDLRKLREGYLMDLEDALRERDALQVIRLSREYTLQKDQATRQYELDKQARKEAYEEEKKQAAIEQAERMKQLYEELQARLAAIAMEKEEERRIAKEEYDKAYAEEVERYEEAKAERLTRLENDQKELEKETDFKTNAFLDRLRAEGVLTQQFLDDFKIKLKDKIGPGSEYEEIMNFFANTAITKTATVAASFQRLFAIIAALNATQGAVDAAIDSLPNPTGQGSSDRYWGGTVIATKPTTVTFGEYEPEFVEFTPLSKLSKSKAMDIASNPLSSEESRLMALSSIGNGRTGSFSSGGQKKNEYAFSNVRGQGISVPTSYGDGRNSMNKFIFEMLLSPDLEARIVSYTLGETADVIMNVLREQQ